MKLKKAMKKYDIKVDKSSGNPHYCVGTKSIFHSGEAGLWWLNEPTDHNLYPEEQAVSWLIEGANPLSPMERAMRKWPIKVNMDSMPDYSLGDRGVFKSDTGCWLNMDGLDMTTYTESEAVSYLLEGYKSGQSFTLDNGELKFGEGDFTIDFTVKRNPELPTMVFKNEAGHVIEFKPKIAQELIDDLWSAGYRPTKEVEKPEN